MAASFWLLSSYVLSRGLHHAGPDTAILRSLRACYLLSTLWTALCLVVAWFSVYPALVMWVLMFAVFAFPRESAAVVARRLAARTPAP